MKKNKLKLEANLRKLEARLESIGFEFSKPGYIPNFSDPRVASKVLEACLFAEEMLHQFGGTELSHSKIAEAFGNNSSDLAHFLRDNILDCVDNHFSFEHYSLCKKYIVRSNRIEILRDVIEEYAPLIYKKYESRIDLNGIDVIKLNNLREKHYNVLSRPEFIEYETKANRLWHAIQFLSKKIKKPLLASFGLVHEYDIESAAATLLSQYAILKSPVALDAIQEYMYNKQAIRIRLSTEYGLTIKEAKQILNSILCGAHLSVNRQHCLFIMLGLDYKKMERLKLDPFILRYRADVKLLWKTIDPQRDIVVDSKTGELKLSRLNCRIKWKKYFVLERKVLDVIIAYLTKTGNAAFLEHDGFTSRRKVNLEELKAAIYDKLELNVNFSYEDLSANYSQYILPEFKNIPYAVTSNEGTDLSGFFLIDEKQSSSISMSRLLEAYSLESTSDVDNFIDVSSIEFEYNTPLRSVLYSNVDEISISPLRSEILINNRHLPDVSLDSIDSSFNLDLVASHHNQYLDSIIVVDTSNLNSNIYLEYFSVQRIPVSSIICTLLLPVDTKMILDRNAYPSNWSTGPPDG